MSDYPLGTTIYVQFTTRAFATGVPAQLAGSPVISVLEENNATPITAGITLSVDRASVTGLNEVAIVASSGNGYETGKEYAAYISTGTVGGTSVVGEVIGRFSIEKFSALRPTTAGRTLDVSAGGEAGVDWANVGSPTTALNLSGTTIATTQKVDVETIKTNPVVNGGTVTFPTGATLASTTNITAATGIVLSGVTHTGAVIPTVTTLTNLPAITANWLTAAGIAADAGAEIADAVWDEAIAGHLGAGSTGAALNGAGSAGDPWTTSLPGAYGAGTAGYLVGTNLNATVSSRQATVTFPTNFSALAITAGGAVTAGTVSDKTGYSLTQAFPTNFSALGITAGGAVTTDVVSNVAAIKVKTDSLTFTVAGQVDANIQYVNDVQVSGTGAVGNEWGPV